VVSNWLELSTARSSPVKLVAAQNDSMAMGARRAFAEKMIGKDREQWGRLPYIGCDACPQTGQQWVRQGLLTASIVLPPAAGRAVELMARGMQAPDALAGSTVLAPSPFPTMDQLAAARAGK
jgi:ribose transport system substrate-binding protein